MTKAQLEAKVLELERRILALEMKPVPIVHAVGVPLTPIDVDYTIVPRRMPPTT